jgi:hypothetical protein
MTKMGYENGKGVTPAALAAALSGDLESTIIATTPGGIERQEAQGQADMVRNCRLPKKLNGYDQKYTIQQAYEKMGIKVLGDADDIFYKVQLPEGWQLKPQEDSSNSYWSNLIDNKGRNRASIFYKAAFYDRSAHISLERRFSCEVEPEDHYEKDISSKERSKMLWQGTVYDGKKAIFATKPIIRSGDASKREAEEKKMLAECEAFLKKNYPKWKDDFAYWD